MTFLRKQGVRGTVCHSVWGFATIVIVPRVTFVHGLLVAALWFAWCLHYGGVVLSTVDLGAYGGVQSRPGMVYRSYDGTLLCCLPYGVVYGLVQ